MPRCNTCNRYFRREDHLRRHESSHGFPQFACQHDGCGMHFHRRDVLKRHEAVHASGTGKQRRRPRRGPLPRIAGDPAQTDRGMHPPCGASSSEVAEPGVSPTSTLSSTLRAADLLNSGTSVSGLDLYPFTMDSSIDTEASRVETPRIDGFEDWLAPYTGSLEDVSHDLGLGIGDDLAQTFEGSAPQDVEDANDPYPGDLCRLPVGREPSFRSQIGEQVDIPGGPATMRRCISSFQKRCLPLLPMLRPSAAQRDTLTMELRFSMAALGAQYIVECRHLASSYFSCAVEGLNRSTTVSQLRVLQTRILLVEYAGWKSSKHWRRWAVKEKEAAKDSMLDLIGRYGGGEASRRIDCVTHEEILRTVFAFYIQAVSLAICYGHTIPLIAQSIPFDLPCDDAIWALEDQGFAERHSIFLDTRVSFQQVLHGLFANTPNATPNLQSLSNFGKEILVCAVLETMAHAKSSPLNYSSFEDYKDGNLSALNMREPLLKAMGICRVLWPAQLHDYYDKSAPSHPEIESTVMLLFAVMQLNRPSDTPRGSCSREAVVAATEIFCSIAKSGFREVKTNKDTFSVRTHYCVGECVKEMVKWLGVVMEAGLEGNVDNYDVPLLLDISGALAQNDMENAVVWRFERFPITADMRDDLLDTWAQLLGSREWAMSK